MAAAYYAGALIDVAALPTRFFEIPGPAGMSAGAAAWLTWSAALAAVQAIAWQRVPSRRWAGVMLGMLMTAIPPAGWFAVASPLNAIGYWFPGAGWLGLALGLAAVAWLANLPAISAMRPHVTAGLGASLVLVSAACWTTFEAPVSPADIVALDLKLGAAAASTEARWDRIRNVGESVEHAPHDAAVLVLPEMAIDELSANTLYWMGEALATAGARGQGLLVGAGRREDSGWRNGAAWWPPGAPAPAWISGRIPMPVGMWRPGSAGFIASAGTAPVIWLGSRKATLAICYEDLLPWTNLQAFWEVPDVHISISSLWFARGLDVELNEARTARSWAILFGVPLLRAVNR